MSKTHAKIAEVILVREFCGLLRVAGNDCYFMGPELLLMQRSKRLFTQRTVGGNGARI